MKVSTGRGGRPPPPPQRPPKFTLFLFSVLFSFLCKITANWIKIEKTQKKKHFYVTLFRDRSVEDCQGYRTLVLFLNEISREKVVKKTHFWFEKWKMCEIYCFVVDGCVLWWSPFWSHLASTDLQWCAHLIRFLSSKTLFFQDCYYREHFLDVKRWTLFSAHCVSKVRNSRAMFS